MVCMCRGKLRLCTCRPPEKRSWAIRLFVRFVNTYIDYSVLFLWISNEPVWTGTGFWCEPVWTGTDMNQNRFQPPPKHINHDKTMKKCKSFKIKVSCLFEGLVPLPNCRPRFLIGAKQISALETSWEPHWWQNNETIKTDIEKNM